MRHPCESLKKCFKQFSQFTGAGFAQQVLAEPKHGAALFLASAGSI